MKTEVRSQKSEVRNQKPEARRKKPGVRNQETDTPARAPTPDPWSMGSILQSVVGSLRFAIPVCLLFGSLAFGWLGEDAGTSVLPLLRTSVGPRPSAMGECFVGLADDATGVYWNPAGLGQSRNTEFFLSHNEWFMGFRDEYASMAIAAGGGRLGIGLVYSGTSGIEAWDADNMPLGNYGTHTGFANVAYGHSVGENCFLGGSAKFLYDKLGWVSGYGGCADFGFLARPWKFLGAGISFQNLGWGMYYSNGTYRLPMTCRAGLSVQQWGFRLLTEAEVPLWGRPCFHFGGEYVPFSALAIRAGYRTGPQDIASLGSMSGMSLGMGLNIGGFSLDYAFAPYGKLGQVHRLGIRTRAMPRGYGTFRIRVLEAGSPYGVPADVEFTGLRTEARTADDDGKYELTKLTEGWLKFTASLPGYVPVTESAYIKGDREQAIALSLRKQGVGTVWGMFIDAATKQSIAGRILYVGPKSGELIVSASDASYALRGMPDGEYVLRSFGPSAAYFPQTCTVRVETSMVVSHDFLFAPKLSATLKLKGVLFDSGSVEIRSTSYAALDELGTVLRENENLVLELAGYTDPLEEGSYQSVSSWRLSDARAEAVQKYLTTKFDIAPERLKIQGYADLYSVAPNNTADGRARNRRVELFVLKE